jgi:hypothetical protein
VSLQANSLVVVTTFSLTPPQSNLHKVYIVLEIFEQSNRQGFSKPVCHLITNRLIINVKESLGNSVLYKMVIYLHVFDTTMED